MKKEKIILGLDFNELLIFILGITGGLYVVFIEGRHPLWGSLVAGTIIIILTIFSIWGDNKK